MGRHESLGTELGNSGSLASNAMASAPTDRILRSIATSDAAAKTVESSEEPCILDEHEGEYPLDGNLACDCPESAGSPVVSTSAAGSESVSSADVWDDVDDKCCWIDRHELLTT